MLSEHYVENLLMNTLNNKMFVKIIVGGSSPHLPMVFNWALQSLRRNSHTKLICSFIEQCNLSHVRIISCQKM